MVRCHSGPPTADTRGFYRAASTQGGSGQGFAVMPCPRADVSHHGATTRVQRLCQWPAALLQVELEQEAGQSLCPKKHCQHRK